MAGSRRLWDSSVIIGYLGGQADISDTCQSIMSQAERGELEIVVSAIATIEVAYLDGIDDQDSEAKIRELFSRDYVMPVAIDVRVAAIARSLVRKYRGASRLRPADAAHLATAILWKIPVLETTDADLLRLDAIEGNPPITIRRPLFEGPVRMQGL